MNTSPRRLLLAYAVALVCFLALDALWLSTTSARLYQPALGPLMASQVDWLAVALFYPLYVMGVVYFAVLPAMSIQSAANAALRGALLGLLAYATYDLTNQATLRGWPWHITLIDLLWGACITGSSAGVAAWIALRATSRPGRRTRGQ